MTKNKICTLIVLLFVIQWACALAVFGGTASDAPKKIIRVLLAENQQIINLTIKEKYQIRILPTLQVVKEGSKMVRLPMKNGL